MKVKLFLVFMLTIIGVTITTNSASAQQQPRNPAPAKPATCPMQDDQMNVRGDRVMGFDHMKTAHHFRLLPDGGAIETTANSAQDQMSSDQIRTHLGHIAKMFAVGDFNAPMLIHGGVPPGVPAMQELKNDIQYTFELTEQGARIRITTSRPAAVQAIHDFLRFQITEHKSGDPLTVSQ